MSPRNITATCKHFPFPYIYSPSQVHPKMQVHLAHSDPAKATASQLHYIPEKITSGQASNGNNIWQTLCSVTRLPAGLRTMARRWCCTKGQCPTGWGAHDHLSASLGTLEQNFNPTPWGCEWIKSFSRSPI